MVNHVSLHKYSLIGIFDQVRQNLQKIYARENLENVLMTPVGLMHLQMMLNMVKSILSSTAAIFLTLWTFRRRNNADTAD